MGENSYYTNETIFTLTELPQRLTVIGAGPVGCELAQAFQRFGSKVTMITYGAVILPKEDRDAAAILRKQLEKDGIRILSRTVVQQVSSEENEKVLQVVSNGKAWEIRCDAILICVGRAPNIEGLGLEEAGVRYTTQGIEVDARLRTSNARV